MASDILHYKSYQLREAAPWVVFIHGAGGSIATWKYQVDAFKSDYNLLLIDLRDHGDSKLKEVATYNFALITEDIIKLLAKLNIHKAHFITLSFGSVLLQYLSMLYPQKVYSAIFAGGIFKANSAIRIFVSLARFFNRILPYSWMYSIFSFLLMPYKHHQKSREIYKKQAAKLNSTAYMRWVGLYGEFFELLNDFYYQKIDFPALIVMGTEDYVFLKSARNFSKQHATVDLQIIPKAGHICNIDRPKAFNEIAYDFIQKVDY